MPVSICETFENRDVFEEPPWMGSRRVSQMDTGSSAATVPGYEAPVIRSADTAAHSERPAPPGTHPPNNLIGNRLSDKYREGPPLLGLGLWLLADMGFVRGDYWRGGFR